jgi:hypothetical protein
MIEASRRCENRFLVAQVRIAALACGAGAVPSLPPQIDHNPRTFNNIGDIISAPTIA